MRRRGFTLLELLLTLVLLVIVLGILHACLGAILASTEHGRAIARGALEGRNLLALIESDLRGAVLVPPKPVSEKGQDEPLPTEDDPNAFAGQSGMIHFATVSPRRGEGGEAPRVVRVIEYTLKPLGDKRFALMRSSKPLDADAPGETWQVTDRVRSLGFRFTDGMEWTDEWNSQTASQLPQAVRIDLTLMAGEKTALGFLHLESSVAIQTASLEPPDEQTKSGLGRK